MKADYTVHDRQYLEARARGWSGWGGNDRMAHGPAWLEQLFSYAAVPQTGDVLELGCGEGHLCRLLAEKGYRVLGVDISPAAIEWAREKTAGTALEVAYLVADLTQADVLPDRAFDLIIDGNCLHCIIDQDRQTFLANVRRLLKDDGLFFVFSRCSQAAQDEIIEFEGRPYRYVATEENLHKELEVAGFALKQAKYHEKEIDGRVHRHCTVHVARRSSQTMRPALVLDIGGVFFLGKHDEAFFARWAKQAGLEPDKLKKLLWFGPDVEQANIGEISAEEYFDRAARRLDIDSATVRAIIEDAFCEPLNRELVAYVRHLKSQRVWITALTNSWSFGRDLIERQGITDLFETIISSAEVGLKKPSPEIYQLLLERLKLDATAVIFVDDSLENIKAAQQFGIRTIHYQSTERTIAALKRIFADHLFPS